MKVQKTGDWLRARKMLEGAPAKLKTAKALALRQEAHALRREIVEGLTKQAPGGERLAKPAPLTLAARRLAGFSGTKALIRNADLRNAIDAIVRGDRAFVGVPRKARQKDGRPMVDVAKVQEFGAGPFVVPITPKMRRYLFVLFQEAGMSRSKGSGRGVVVIRIPPRPFLRPAFNVFARGVRQRFLGRVAGILGMGGMR